MEAAQILWRPIGELFVARGLISEEQLELALAEQAATGKRLGEILVACNPISSPELTQVLMEQLGQDVAKEDGFGSGLWSEIRRRRGRESPARKLVVDDDPSAFGAALGEPLNADLLDDSTVAELDQDFEELRSELGIVALRSPSPAAAPDIELGSEAREEVEARRGSDELPEPFPDEETGLAELEATLRERDVRIEELQSRVAEIECESGAREESLALLGARAAELEQALGAARTDGDRAAAADAELAAERDGHGDTRRRLEEALAEAARAQEALTELGRGFEGIRGERDDACRELDEARAAVARLEASSTAATDECAAADAALAAEREAHAATGRRLKEPHAAHEADLRQERAARAESLYALERDLETVVNDRDSVRVELEQARAAAKRAESRAAELDGQVSALADRLAAAESILAEERDTASGDEELYALDDHLCFAPGSDGYRLASRPGPPPEVGSPYDLDGVDHVVTRAGRSPLPFDPRRCVYLQAVS